MPYGWKRKDIQTCAILCWISDLWITSRRPPWYMSSRKRRSQPRRRSEPLPCCPRLRLYQSNPCLVPRTVLETCVSLNSSQGSAAASSEVWNLKSWRSFLGWLLSWRMGGWATHREKQFRVWQAPKGAVVFRQGDPPARHRATAASHVIALLHVAGLNWN